MASRAPSDPFLIEVRFSRRDDGGLRAECDQIPGFFLSHSDPDLVYADVGPALGVILSEMYGTNVVVQRVRDLGELENEIPPAHVCDAQRYVGMARSH